MECVGALNRQSLTGLQKLRQLTALTLLAAAEPWQQQQQWGGNAAAIAAAGLGAGAAAAAAVPGVHMQQQQQALPHGLLVDSLASSSNDSPWLLLLQLPHLRELMVGVVPRTQTLNLTTTLTQNLEPPSPHNMPDTHLTLNSAAHSDSTSHIRQQQEQQGLGSEGYKGRPGRVLSHNREQQRQQQQQQGLAGECGWFLQGCGGQRYVYQEGAAVTAYVTPGQWSELADMQVGACCRLLSY
jgi:hypothetical protein